MKKRLSNNLDEGRISGQRILWVFALFIGLTSQLSVAQEKFLVEGIFDTELYNTDASSRLLARNNGDVSTLLRLQLWSAFQISPKLQFFAMGEFEFDNSSSRSETESELEQLALRYSSNTNPFYYVEAGKLSSPSGSASRHNLSTLNWLIGQPNAYYISYPWGIRVAGSRGKLDYRLALLDSPVIVAEYQSYPSTAYRPALSLGLTPFTGLRFGVSYTKGPYLSRQLVYYLPPGDSWRDFDQRILRFDIQFSRGYFELNGELIFSAYDVPYQSKTTDGTDYYLEMKYTWTPRVYGAVRFEKNKNVTVSRLLGISRLASDVELKDVEISLGYRFSPDTQIKLAYRRNHWDGRDDRTTLLPDGHSLAVQLSHQFDLMSWFVKNL
jgi:hypothetical protein